MRYDGASHLYAPPEYPAAAHYQVIQACITAAERMGVRYHVGTTRSADTFYACHPRPGSSFNNFWQSNWRDHFEDLKRLNVVAAEMEASVIFVLSRAWGLRAGGISVVLDNVLKVSGESGEFDPEAGIDHSAEYIERLAQVGCEVVKVLYELDQAKS
jgi:uridine phosphorylase